MYTVVLMAAMSTSSSAPESWWHHHDVNNFWQQLHDPSRSICYGYTGLAYTCRGGSACYGGCFGYNACYGYGNWSQRPGAPAPIQPVPAVTPLPEIKTQPMPQGGPGAAATESAAQHTGSIARR